MLIISLDDYYDGEIYSRQVHDDVEAILEKGSNRIVRFQFNGDWNRESAVRWLKKRNLYKVSLFRRSNGSILVNSICLSARMIENAEADKSEIVDLFGKEVYERIMEIEDRHGSDKPFVVKNMAMDFKGKDFVVANGIKFYRDQVKKSISLFSGIRIRLGHPDFFATYNKNVGNTIGAHLDENGNPIAYAYIHPHGEAGEFREDLRIAEAQNRLGNYEVSMYGDPIEYETVNEDSIQKEHGARVLMHDWKPTAMDYVDEGAIAGSRALEVANSAIETVYNDDEGGKVVNLTEILAELSKMKMIALSDFLGIDSFKAAIEAHVKAEIEKTKLEMSKDKDFINSAIENMPESEIIANSRIASFVTEKANEKREQINKKIDSIAKIAEANSIELTEQQMFLVKMNLSGDEKEEDIIKLINSAKMFERGLGVSRAMFSDEENKEESKIAMSSYGASLSVVSVSDVKDEI